MKYTLKYVKTNPTEKYQGYAGHLMELPGVCSQGETLEELKENIKDALEVMLEVLKEEQEEEPVVRGWEKAKTTAIEL